MTDIKHLFKYCRKQIAGTARASLAGLAKSNLHPTIENLHVIHIASWATGPFAGVARHACL
jgi:hypothetical protein